MTMLRHSEIWRALDRLAAKNGWSASGLARRAGLDPTAFNKSKRRSPTGKPRWPSTESVAKCLTATNESLGGFLALMGDHGVGSLQRLPLLPLAKAGASGRFDDSGHPTGRGWDDIESPGVGDPHAYALRVAGNALAPIYRPDDLLIVSPEANVRRGDRVVVKTRDGEVSVREFLRQSANAIELRSLNGKQTDRKLNRRDVLWLARVLWVRQ